MKRAFTLIELMIVIAIIAIIAAIAIPQLITNREKIEKDYIRQGDEATVIETGMRVKVVGYENSSVLICRIDNGPEAPLRYQEMRFTRDELRKILPKVER